MLAKIAFLFPGQGAQQVGMGRDFYEQYPAAREVFDRAAAVLGDRLLEIIFSGPEELLQQTENTQPAVLTVSIAIYRVLEQHGCKPQAVAGLSLGEYSALVAAGAISFEDALPLVQKRGRYMQEAVPQGVGAMAAIIGLDREKVEEACRAAEKFGTVAPANYNCPGQIVIAGHAKAVKEAGCCAKVAGARRVIELKVSAPFHTALLEQVEAKMAVELDKIEIKAAAIPVVANRTASFQTDPGQIKKALIEQVSHPVYWEDSIRTMLADGFDTFIEPGPGRALTGFIKKIDRTRYAAAVDSCKAMEAVLNHFKEG